MSVEEMVQFCRDALADAQPQAEAAAAFGTEFGLPLVVYEGGPAIVEATAIHNGGVDVPLARKFMALHRHPDMQGLYRDYLELFKAAGIPGYEEMELELTSCAWPRLTPQARCPFPSLPLPTGLVCPLCSLALPRCLVSMAPGTYRST